MGLKLSARVYANVFIATCLDPWGVTCVDTFVLNFKFAKVIFEPFDDFHVVFMSSVSLRIFIFLMVEKLFKQNLSRGESIMVCYYTIT